MTQYKTIDDLDLNGKTALVRVDINVPMKDGIITDATRLERILPTIKDLQRANAKIVLLAHFGRPKGEHDPDLSLRPVAKALSDLLRQSVAFADDCIGDAANQVVTSINFGQIAVLENTRFYAEETANDPIFAKKLAILGDVYINDAFSAAHRAHASTEGLAKLLPSAAGRLMESELKALSQALDKPERPLAALVGGAKISTKLDLLHNLIKKVDTIVLGGGMANTFLAAKGVNVGASLYEEDMLDTARSIMAEAEKQNCYILLPTDAIVAKELTENAPAEIISIGSISEDQKIFDLGPATVEEINTKLNTCKTVVWNGPLGVFEVKPFDKATTSVAAYVASRTNEGALLSVAGGGDTVAALANAGVMSSISYISTAGGAFLEWMEGKPLPGVEALKG